MIGPLTAMATTRRHALAGEAATIGRRLGEGEDWCWIERSEHRSEATNVACEHNLDTASRP